MIFKIRTSKKTMEIFEEIGASENLQPFILAKLALSMSLKSGQPLTEKQLKTDTLGLELNRQTITGEFDNLYKCLIEVFEGKHIDEDEYLPKYLKAHLDRGAVMIHSEFRYGRDFLLQLLNDDIGL